MTLLASDSVMAARGERCRGRIFGSAGFLTMFMVTAAIEQELRAAIERTAEVVEDFMILILLESQAEDLEGRWSANFQKLSSVDKLPGMNHFCIEP